mmetsp:Transcript_24213/g.53005  ORF Transcript_24213/g.53005 Transcript_24213/m.53005 type:complete len:211 (+) Transcript_24213:57-689(+)
MCACAVRKGTAKRKIGSALDGSALVNGCMHHLLRSIVVVVPFRGGYERRRRLPFSANRSDQAVGNVSEFISLPAVVVVNVVVVVAAVRTGTITRIVVRTTSTATSTVSNPRLPAPACRCRHPVFGRQGGNRNRGTEGRHKGGSRGGQGTTGCHRVSDGQEPGVVAVVRSSTAAAIIFEIVAKGIAQGHAALSRFLQGWNVAVAVVAAVVR